MIKFPNTVRLILFNHMCIKVVISEVTEMLIKWQEMWGMIHLETTLKGYVEWFSLSHLDDIL